MQRQVLLARLRQAAAGIVRVQELQRLDLAALLHHGHVHRKLLFVVGHRGGDHLLPAAFCLQGEEDLEGGGGRITSAPKEVYQGVAAPVLGRVQVLSESEEHLSR